MSRGEAGSTGFLQMSISSEPGRSGTQRQRCLLVGEGRTAQPLQPDSGWGLVTLGTRSLLWRSQGNSPFQDAFPSFQVLFCQHESPHFPVWELSVRLLRTEVLAGWVQVWMGGCSPCPLLLTPLFELPSKDWGHQQQTGPTHSWADVGTRRLSEGWTGRQWQDQEKNTHFGIPSRETGNRHDELNYRLEILSTFWWWG